ncbi:hypothetical protein SRABI84_05324 [Peribacillus simplex]|nr:hypothetical protein SRABI84_05324 [Peribacillus simplex]
MLSEEKELRYLGVDFVNLMFARVLRPTSNFGLLPPRLRGSTLDSLF